MNTPNFTLHEPTDIGALLHMKHFGTAFEGHLARAWMAADSQEDARLRAAFPELYERYLQRAYAARATYAAQHVAAAPADTAPPSTEAQRALMGYGDEHGA